MFFSFEDRPYSRSQWIKATNLSGALGAVSTVLYTVFRHALRGGDWAQAPITFAMMLIYAIPVGLVLSWVFVAPLLPYLMKKEVTKARAVAFGSLVGSGMVALSVAIGRYQGWKQHSDGIVRSQVGGGDFVRSIDGILTPYGWWVLAQSSLAFVVTCVLVSLIVHRIIGPGQHSDAK